MYGQLTYQQKVLLAAAEICRESDRNHDSQTVYKMYFINGSLYLEPSLVFDGRERKFADVVVGTDRILSRDETIAKELEEKVKAMFG